jgi:hypothetical protein
MLACKWACCSEFQKLLTDQPDHIYNADETGLQWKGPNMHLAFEKEKQTAEQKSCK